MPRGSRASGAWFLVAFIILLMLPLRDTLPGGAEVTYNHAWRLFQQGYLARSQWEAEEGYKQYQRFSPHWAAEFQLLSAESMLYRGMYDGVLKTLASYHDAGNRDGAVKKLTLEAIALTRQDEVADARQRLTQADALCGSRKLRSCGDVPWARALLAVKAGQFVEARQHLLETLAIAHRFSDHWLQASTTLNLGYIAMQLDHYDEAVDWSRSAYQVALADGYKNIIQTAAGNLGWAYYQLGDSDRALEQFIQAEASARELGNVRFQLKWLSTAGYVYQDSGDWTRALEAYRRSLSLARTIDSREDIVNALEDLAAISVESGQLNAAGNYIAEVTRIENAGTGRLSANLHETQCMLAAARHEREQAESCFRAVRVDPSALVTIRLDAGYRLAGLFEGSGNNRSAEETYRSTLDTFRSARATLKSEETELPFGANASRIYDSYIQLLMREGKTEEALVTADESRAGTLEKGLDSEAARLSPALLHPQQIAQKAQATLLFYWLGEKQSYLWAITPKRIAAFTLPPQIEIAGHVRNYNRRILALRDPLRGNDPDGESLYKLLIAPAASLIQPARRVIILSDGELSRLNFETLLVPDHASHVHYLIDDLTLVSAPSLAMLQVSSSVQVRGNRILLLGDPVSPSKEFPSLPLFGFEMNRIESHFEKNELAVFTGRQATAASYLAGNPAQYSYIHFVSHAVANRMAPLDSAIVLSRSSADENSFKLYARDIIQRPIDARLVTISACYGSGTRSYAGEGLVGLSWAFLRAGAQRVIGALWEVSDDSTPRLMDRLYQGIEEGNSPAFALRKAKLTLLHSQSRFSLPFYWATFQIYDRK